MKGIPQKDIPQSFIKSGVLNGADQVNYRNNILMFDFISICTTVRASEC